MEVAEREEPRGALDGIHVLDVAEPFGAYVSRILGDLGADVIKIEPPGGDPGRQMVPLLPGCRAVEPPFVHANLNKRSIVLDVHQPQDQERFRALARRADVVVSTEGVATWGARGVDLNRLSADFPRLIWTSLTPSVSVAPTVPMSATTSSLRPWGASCTSRVTIRDHRASLPTSKGCIWLACTRPLARSAPSGSGGQRVWPGGRGVGARGAGTDLLCPGALFLWKRHPAPHRRPQPAACKRLLSLPGRPCLPLLFQPHQWDRLVELMQDPVLLQPAFRDRDYQLAHAD